MKAYQGIKLFDKNNMDLDVLMKEIVERRELEKAESVKEVEPEVDSEEE